MTTHVFCDMATGRTLEISPAEEDGERVAMAAAPKGPFPLAADDLADVVAALHEAHGLPAPLILPRPEVSPAVGASLGSFGVWLHEGGDVVFAFGSSAIDIDPEGALAVAALIAAYAEAGKARGQEQEPDRADVERLGALVTEASRMAPEDAARYLLRKGVTLPAEGDGNG